MQKGIGIIGFDVNCKPVEVITIKLNKMKKYIISPVTVYDDEQELWATKVGIEGKTMPLHYTVWGQTEQQSRERAERLGEILTAHYTSNPTQKQ